MGRGIVWIIAALVSLLGCMADEQKRATPEIIYPLADTVVSLDGLVVARLADPKSAPTDYRSIRFEASSDLKSWTAFSEQAIDPREWAIEGRWEAMLNPTTLPSGANYLRISLLSETDGKAESKPVNISINRRPTAVIAVSDGEKPGVINFSAAGSTDEDGEIQQVRWDFGDGSTAEGLNVSHAYAGLSGTYQVTVSTIDNLGATSSAYYDLFFDYTTPPPPPPHIRAERIQYCRCTDIALRTDGAALGPDAKPGGNEWPASERDDGRTLGPLSLNPGNQDADFLGMAFEIVATVEGDPGACKEIQLVKSTMSGELDNDDKFSYASKWTGKKADIDLDGNADIDEPNEVTLEFPRDGNRYQPDARTEAGNAYRKPYDYKSHTGNKVIWFDHPSNQVTRMIALRQTLAGLQINTDSYKTVIDFIHMLRGTDDKYCYIKSTVRYASSSAQDVLSEGMAYDPPQIGADSVPGIP